MKTKGFCIVKIACIPYQTKGYLHGDVLPPFHRLLKSTHSSYAAKNIPLVDPLPALLRNAYLSHHTLVLNLSAPCAAIAAFILAELTDNSEVGYVSLLIKVPFGTSGFVGWP